MVPGPRVESPSMAALERRPSKGFRAVLMTGGGDGTVRTVQHMQNVQFLEILRNLATIFTAHILSDFGRIIASV